MERWIVLLRKAVVLAFYIAVVGVILACEASFPNPLPTPTTGRIATGTTTQLPIGTSAISFHQRFVEGLYSTLNLKDPDSVFKFVFSNLDDEVIVYPTENYYYFQFSAAGKTIWGNLRLDAKDRDKGIIHLGLFVYDEARRFQGYESVVAKSYSSEDGVLVRRIDRFTYSVTYQGKTVIFHLNDIGMRPPQNGKLRQNEVFISPIYDESGLKFFLIFDQQEKHFMYVLNEEGYVPEEFSFLFENVALGKRTGFAFYEDGENNRKILIGVHRRNLERNNYYDGPFDQLSDNYASETNIKKYIEEAYPFAKGKIDDFGGYTTQQRKRIAITPYRIYSHERELKFVNSCKSTNLSEDKFYSCITPDFIGGVPKFSRSK